MFKLFNYLYYLIAKFYLKKEKGGASSAAGVIGGLQAMNVLAIYMFLSFYVENLFKLNKVSVLIVVIVFQITTYIQYIYKEKPSIKDMREKWLNLDESKRTKIRISSFLYIILTLVAFFGSAIFVYENTK